MNNEKFNNEIVTFDPEKTKKRFILLFTLVGLIALLFFGSYNFYYGEKAISIVEYVASGLGVINLIAVFKFNKVRLGSTILLLIMFSLLIYLLISGGVDNTGVFWFFTFPALAFFLKDRRSGIMWVMLLAIASGLVGLFNYAGYVGMSIGLVSLRQLLASLLAVSLIIYFYEDTNEKEEEIIIKQNKEVANAVNNLSSEISVRKSSEEELEKAVKDYEDKNELLENTKKAVINLLEDVEEEKTKASDERERLNTILQSIGDGVFVVNKDLEIVLINPTALNLAGIPNEDVIGQDYRKVLKFVYEESGKTNDKFVVEAIKLGSTQTMEGHTSLVRSDGEKISVSDSAAPLKNNEGKVVGCVVVFRDISKEREVDKAKTEFVSLASHQLRTPLSAMNWYSEMLLNGDAGKLNAEQADFVHEIAEGNKRMVDLVNSLLNVSRIDLGTFTIDPKPSDIIKIAESVVKELEVTIKTKQIKMITNFDKLEKVNVDPQLTRIIFQNLLSNAVKYTPDKGTVELDITKKEPNILIKVSDTGYGIPKDQQNKIFEKLFRADNVKATKSEGTGLGLYIVKSILDTSGGKVWFESEENKGTTFYVEIPLTGMIQKKGTKTLS